MTGISGSLIWSKTLMELIFKPCGEFRWSPEGPVSQIHSTHLHVGAPGIFSGLLRSFQREWIAECNGKLPHLFNPWQNGSLVSWVCGGRRPTFGKSAAYRYLRLQWKFEWCGCANFVHIVRFPRSWKTKFKSLDMGEPYIIHLYFMNDKFFFFLCPPLWARR